MKQWAIVLAWCAALAAWTSVHAAVPRVCYMEIEGPIGPVTADYVTRSIEAATEKQATCLIIRLNTPGGALDATQVIVQRFLASPVPTVVYVAPSGAGATSAGCFITLAADVAAMAPTTNIGAAHPVSIGGGGEQQMSDTMKEKVENYCISFIEGVASRRQRNVEWAKSSVQKSASITAENALKMHVVEIIARDMPDLLKQLEGRKVRDLTLHTAGAEILTIPMSVSEKFLNVLSNPNLFYILMLVAIYGILGELNNPGAILPGVAGAIALVLMLYMLSILPVNATGLAMIVLAVILFVIDIFAPTHGILTGGGIVAFFIGSLMLFDQAPDVYSLSLTLIIPATVVTALFFLFVLGKGLAAQRWPVQVGRETMIGQATAALSKIDAAGGRVFIEGEYWNAVSDQAVEAGQTVVITGITGLTLHVKAKV